MFNTINKTLECLNPKQVYQLIFIILFSFLSNILDFVGLLAIIPLIAKISSGSESVFIQEFNFFFDFDFLLNKNINFYLFFIAKIFLKIH